MKGRGVVWVVFMHYDFFVCRSLVSIEWGHLEDVMSFTDVHCVFSSSSKIEEGFLKVAGIFMTRDKERGSGQEVGIGESGWYGNGLWDNKSSCFSIVQCY